MCIIINGIPSNYKDEISQEEIDKNFDELWKDTILSLDGSVNLEQVKRELFDYSFLMNQASEVYCTITNGKLSKTNYFASTIIGENESYIQEMIEEEVEERTKDFQLCIENLESKINEFLTKNTILFEKLNSLIL